MLNPSEIDCVIYHHPCADGAGSAYVVWKYFRENFPEKKIEYFPMNIGSKPPQNLTGKNVLICDYSYKKEIVQDLTTKVNKLLIIDHHKSAEKDLKDIDDNLKIFDMNQSGAMLTWKYFFPDKEPPLLIKYIQDRDLWTKKLENTDDFASWFFTLPFDFDEYDKYIDENLLIQMIKTRGVSFGELNNYYVNQSAEKCIPKFSKIGDKYYVIGYINSTICKSDVGNRIFDGYPLIDFSAVYSINDADDSTSFSLRSTPKRANVSEIAFSMGGGGHVCASGVKVEYVTNHLPGKVYDSGKIYEEISKIYYGKFEDKYNVVYMCSTMCKTSLGSYLLQDKYTEGETRVQVCQNISKIMEKEYPQSVQMAAIWCYNPVEDETTFEISFDKSIEDEERERIGKRISVDGIQNVIMTDSPSKRARLS